MEAAIAAYNDSNPGMLPPPEAVQLLTVMFRQIRVC
jgi:hypothetical protein